MLEAGDLVKVTGKTINEKCEEAELIPIGTICRVIDVDENDGTVEIIPVEEFTLYGNGFWYLPKDLEKGRLEWIPDYKEEIARITWVMEDILGVMEECGLSASDEHVDMVLTELGVETHKCSLEDCSHGFDSIHDAVADVSYNIKRMLSKWQASEYDNGETIYYVESRKPAIGDKAYVVTEEEIKQMEIIHIIFRSNDEEYYDNLCYDYLTDEECKYNSDASCEFITDDDAFLIWFKQK